MGLQHPVATSESKAVINELEEDLPFRHSANQPSATCLPIKILSLINAKVDPLS